MRHSRQHLDCYNGFATPFPASWSFELRKKGSQDRYCRLQYCRQGLLAILRCLLTATDLNPFSGSLWSGGRQTADWAQPRPIPWAGGQDYLDNVTTSPPHNHFVGPWGALKPLDTPDTATSKYGLVIRRCLRNIAGVLHLRGHC